jgi:hypothetical protein
MDLQTAVVTIGNLSADFTVFVIIMMSALTSSA